MIFSNTDSQRMIADAVRRLLVDRYGFETRQHRLASDVPDRMALWPDLAELGVIGAMLPETFGGFGGTARDVGVVLYAFGRALVVEPYLGVLAASRILLATSNAQGDAPGAGPGTGPGTGPALEALMAGERITVLAHEEGHDPFARPATTAITAASGFVLSGSKSAIRHAELADDFIVTACLDGRGPPCCFLVPRDATGLVMDAHRRLDGAGGASLRLNCVPAELLLGGQPAAAAILDALEWGVVARAAEAVGIMDALNEKTRDYLLARVQFGMPIARFQALQHRAADMHIAAQEAMIATDAVLEVMDGPPCAQRSARVAALKLVVDRAGRRVGHDAVQLHGGMGVSDELDISHYMRRLAAIRAELGTEEVHRARFLAPISRDRAA